LSKQYGRSMSSVVDDSIHLYSDMTKRASAQ
jgi:hypothetical protein